VGPLGQASHWARLACGVADRTSDAARRAAFLARLRKAAWQHGSTLDLDVADDLYVGKRVRLTVAPLTHMTIRIGRGCRLDDDVRLWLKSGELVLGDVVDVRPGVLLSVDGRLVVEGSTPVNTGSVLHCSNDIHVGPRVTFGEYVTVTDSSHYLPEIDANPYHHVRTGRVVIGEGTWLCAKSTIARDAVIGKRCVVGAGSVVVGTVPDDSLASGVPAVVTPLSRRGGPSSSGGWTSGG
jgi:acetyltransferase-like isoleucine patch superfamily enzyme